MEVKLCKLETLKKNKPQYYWAYMNVSDPIRFDALLHSRYCIESGEKYYATAPVTPVIKRRIYPKSPDFMRWEALFDPSCCMEQVVEYNSENHQRRYGAFKYINPEDPGFCIIYKNDSITGSIIAKKLKHLYDKIVNNNTVDIENTYQFYYVDSYCNVETSMCNLREVKQMIKRYVLIKDML